MKQTGVIRKIDELGRIVLPKEIRRNLGIKDGENLEIFVDENGVYLQKYSKILDLKKLGDVLVTEIGDCLGINALIVDRDKVVSASVKNYDINLSSEIDHLMNEREEYASKQEESFFGLTGYFLMKPIIVSTDCLGMIILMKDKAFNEWENNFLKFLTMLFVRKIEL